MTLITSPPTGLGVRTITEAGALPVADWTAVVPSDGERVLV